jgi:Peptidase inhibitor I78 family
MMRIGTFAGVTLVAAALAACQPYASEPGDAGAATETPDLCLASQAGMFIGKIDGAANRTAIVAATMAENIRWITPGMAVTMDYRSDRLNVRIDEQGKYTGFECG